MIRILFFIAFILASCSKENKTFTTEDAAAFQSVLKGKVQNKQGAMPGVLVVANPGGYTTVTGLDGSYTLGQLRSGRYSIQFLKEDYRDTMMSDTIEVGLREEVEVNSIKLKYRYATIKGSVVNANGEAEIGAGIVVEEQDGGAITQSNGNFTLAKIEPGTVRLFSVMQGTGYGYADVTLEPDSTYTNVKVALNKRGGVVKGSVLDGEGKPVGNASINAFKGAIKTTTNSMGVFEITEMPKEGDNRIQIVKGENTTYCGGMNLQGSDTLQIGNIVLDKTPDAEIVIPHSTHFATTTDSSMLVMPWSSASDSVKPLWFYWSFDSGKTWKTTTDPRLLLVPALLGWNANDYTILVKCATMDSVESNIASISVKVSGPEIQPIDTASHSSAGFNSSSSNSKSSASALLAPVITLGVGDTVPACLGKRFVEPTYSVTDDKDSNLTAKVVVDTSKLKINTVGVYPVRYYVTDSDGLKDSAVRYVKVENWNYLSQGTDSIVIDDFEQKNGNWYYSDSTIPPTYLATIRLAEGLPVHNYWTSGWFSFSDADDGGNSYLDPSFGNNKNPSAGAWRVLRTDVSGSNYAGHATFHKGTVGDSKSNYIYGGIGIYMNSYEVNDPDNDSFPPKQFFDLSNLQSFSFDAKGSGNVCFYFNSDILWKSGNDGWGSLEKCITLTSSWTHYLVNPSELIMDRASKNSFTWNEMSARISSFEFKSHNSQIFDLYIDNVTFYGVSYKDFMKAYPTRF